MTQRTIEVLPRDECIALLGTAHVGRLVSIDATGPVAIPVNFALADGAVVFRVEPGTKEMALSQEHLSFEVDHVDDDTHSAWSVLVRGTAEEVAIDDVPDLLRHMHNSIPTPWVVGVHSEWVRIVPRSVTGRRLGLPAESTAF